MRQIIFNYIYIKLVMHDTHIYILCNICIYYYYYYYLMLVEKQAHIYICSYNKDYYYSYYDLYIDSYSKFVMQIYIPLLILIHL
jgi:hypothetical protein